MQTSDIVIIGGGIAGVGLAAELQARASQLRITVVEQESQAGYHSTGRSAAIWIESYGNDCIRELNSRSLEFFRRSADTTGGDLLRKRGMLLCATDSEIDQREVESLLVDAPTAVEEIGADKVKTLVPILQSGRYQRFIYEAGASDIDVARLHQGWLSAFKKSGGRIVTGEPVRRLTRDSGEWIVTTETSSLRAPTVVNAAGAWADLVAELAGAKPQQLTPMRRSAAILEVSGGWDVSQWPLFAEITETWYAKPESGRLMVSPADEDPVEPCDAWVDDEVLASGIDRFEQAVSESVSRVHHQWAGLRTFAPDRTPVVGFDPMVDNFFWLAGHGGYGIQTSPALSKLAGDLLLETSTDGELANRMSPGRTQ